MEMEYQDSPRRTRLILVVGAVLAVAAGLAAVWLLGSAGRSGGGTVIDVQRTVAVVAVRPIPARTAIAAGDVAVRQVPIGVNTAQGLLASVDLVIGRVATVPILQGQLVTVNLLASTASGATIAILGPTETVSPSSEAARALSLTVPADRAAAGFLEVGQAVDIIVTIAVTVPAALAAEGRYTSDLSTKVVYQNKVILARTGDQYIFRTTVGEAEEINQLLASSGGSFSLALRPDADVRIADATGLGETTAQIIAKYGLPIPETYPAGAASGPIFQPLPARSPGAAASSAPGVPGAVATSAPGVPGTAGS